MNFKQIIVSIIIGSVFISCGETKSNDIDAEFAKANIQTAQGFLGSDYKIINTPDNNSRTLNPYDGVNSGTKDKKFKANEKNKTYTQNYFYNNYQNKEFNDICDINITTVINGDLFCNGDYYDKIGDSYKFSNKLCKYENNFTSKFIEYENGSTKYYDFINNTRIKNITYTNTITHVTLRKENWKYTYTKDEGQKLVTIDYKEGRYYFDNLSKYITISNKPNIVNIETRFDLCNDNIYSGVLYFDTLNSVIKFNVISTNIVRVSKLVDENKMLWEEIATFEKK